MRWANKIGREGKSLDEVRDTGTGIDMHKVFEKVVRGEDVPWDELTLRQRGLAQAIVRWFEGGQRRVLHTEVSLSSAKYMLRGRTDYVRACVLPSCQCAGTGAVLGDLKTGGLRVYVESHLQVAGYVWLWHLERREPKLCRSEVLAVDGRGKYDVIPCPATPRDFAQVLFAHEAVGRVRDRMTEYQQLNG
jgi:hypothetical protein